jgi:hypothetical protein
MDLNSSRFTSETTQCVIAPCDHCAVWKPRSDEKSALLSLRVVGQTKALTM